MDQRDNLTGAAPHSNSPPAGQPATEPPSSSATTNPAAAAGTFSDGDSLAGQIAEDPAEGVFVSNPLAAGGPTPTPQLLASLARAGSTTSLGSTLRRPGAGGDDSAEASVRRAFSLNRLRAGGEMAGSPEVGAPGPPSEPKAEDPAAATAAVADHETDQLLHGLAGAGKVPPPPGAAPAPGRPFTTVDLLQASIRETRLHELALERGRLQISQRSRLAGWLFKTWTVSQEGVALFIAGIIIAFVVCFLELSRDWLSSLRRGYCARATQFWLDQEACCAVAAALAQGTSVSPGGGGQLLAPVSPVSEGIVVVLDTPCPDFVTWAEIIGSNQSGLLLLVQLAFA
ncbi:hypothetical protein H696_01853 [Fonticula alba]|uniref:Uncharacterized protein n=1 Tax=Fonticula alba TaxID=691883 RepID=A0A058ZBV3_FONAL|nr:hypothetical protein H696_01853 [Fonticula alba]KCV70907.1 hypothetical protein H696_01853 [Fonticula alba]|eukprot:XP_009494030.1 hypothetical protein H696_01853 [Fonticula alba]